jgi:hypothetical protein
VRRDDPSRDYPTCEEARERFERSTGLPLGDSRFLFDLAGCHAAIASVIRKYGEKLWMRWQLAEFRADDRDEKKGRGRPRGTHRTRYQRPPTRKQIENAVVMLRKLARTAGAVREQIGNAQPPVAFAVASTPESKPNFIPPDAAPAFMAEWFEWAVKLLRARRPGRPPEDLFRGLVSGLSRIRDRRGRRLGPDRTALCLAGRGLVPPTCTARASEVGRTDLGDERVVDLPRLTADVRSTHKRIVRRSRSSATSSTARPDHRAGRTGEDRPPPRTK